VAWVMRARQDGRIGKPVAALAVMAMVLTLAGWSAGTWRQCKLWHDSETLWRAAVDADGGCAICRNNLAAAITTSGSADPVRLREAEAHLRQSIARNPRNPDPYLNLGALLARQRRLREAEPFLEAYARLAPGRAEAMARLGMLRVDQERFADAIPSLRAALRLDPGHRLARADLARALAAVAAERRHAGRVDEATVLEREAGALGPAGR